MTYANKSCSLCIPIWQRQGLVIDLLSLRYYGRSALSLGNQGSDIDGVSGRRCLGCHLVYLLGTKVNLVFFMARFDKGLSVVLDRDWYMGIGVLNSGWGDNDFMTELKSENIFKGK